MALVNASEPSDIQLERKRIHAEEKEEKIIREKIRNNLCGMGSFYLPDDVVFCADSGKYVRR